MGFIESEEKQTSKKTDSVSQRSQKAATSRKTKVLVGIIVILILIIIGMIVGWMLFGRKKKEQTADKPTLITEDNADQVIGDLEDDSADTMFNCRMTYNWSFNGKKSEDAYVANTDYNHYPIYFEVRDDNSQDIIYKSATIPVGSEINGITLDQKLSMGVHPATVIYHLVNDKGEEVSSTAFTITIQVVGN